MVRKVRSTLEFMLAMGLTAAGAGYSLSQAVGSSGPAGWLCWGWLAVACVAGFVAVGATASDDAADESNGEGW